jgi:hypothetical protein
MQAFPRISPGLFGNDGETTAGIGLSPGWTAQTQPGYAYIDVSSGEGWILNNFGSEPPIQGFAVDNNFDYNDALNWEHGKHITKFGFDFLRYQQDYYQHQRYRRHAGTFHLQRQPTANWNAPIENDEGYGFAEFLLDEASKLKSPAFMARSDSGSGAMPSLFRMTGR